MSAVEPTPDLEPAYVRELVTVIRDLVDAAIDARELVSLAVDFHGVSTTRKAMRDRRVLEALDGAIAEGQARL